MKIKYLGTAAAEGVPALFCNCQLCKAAKKAGGKEIRSRSQAIIDGNLLVDFSPDTFMHMAAEKLDLSAVRTLLVTHSHYDHFVPNELGMRGGGYAKNMTAPLLEIYCNQRVKAEFDRAKEGEFSKEILNGLKLCPLERYKVFNTAGYTVTPLPANHALTENAFVFLIEKGGKSVLYCNDTGILFDETIKFLKQRNKPLGFIGMDCTYGVNYYGSGTHMGLKDNKELVDKLNAAGVIDSRTVCLVTHFSHHNIPLHAELCRQAEKYGFVAAYDGIEIEI